jgi:hypothetical protein
MSTIHFSHCIKLLGLVSSITFTFSCLEYMYRLYVTLFRSKLEYGTLIWNSMTSTDANKLERIQQRISAVCFNYFFPQVNYSYSVSLEELKLHTLGMRRYCLDELFLIQVYLGYKFCPSVLKLFVLEFLLGISETWLCSMDAPHVKIVPLLDVNQLLMLFAGTLTYSEPETFSLIIFYNMLQL